MKGRRPRPRPSYAPQPQLGCGPCPPFPFLSMSGLEGGLERSASDVHHTLCALVSTNAATQPAWADYAALMLSAETAAFFEARLPDAKAAAVVDGESNAQPQPSKKKKRKRNAASDDDGDESTDEAALICEHCGGVVPVVSLRVASLDGTTLALTVPQRGLVREVKRMVGQVRGEETWFADAAAKRRAASHSQDCPSSDHYFCSCELCAAARHRTRPDRALCGRQGGRPA